MDRVVQLVLVCVAGGLILLTYFGVASGPGDEEPVPRKVEGQWYASVELRDDLHQVDAFFASVEAWPPDGWPVVSTRSHTAESVSFSLLQLDGVSVPTQFADRSRPLIFSQRERARFDAGMAFVWALVSQCETLIIRNPKPVTGGIILCDVFVVLGGNELNLAALLIAEGHARPEGNWDWGARIVEER